VYPRKLKRGGGLTMKRTLPVGLLLLIFGVGLLTKVEVLAQSADPTITPGVGAGKKIASSAKNNEIKEIIKKGDDTLKNESETSKTTAVALYMLAEETALGEGNTELAGLAEYKVGGVHFAYLINWEEDADSTLDITLKDYEYHWNQAMKWFIDASNHGYKDAEEVMKTLNEYPPQTK